MALVTPEKLAEPGTEEAHQTALLCWAAQEQAAGRFPELRWLHHVPNGGARDSITAGKMKASGVKSGVWDLCLPAARKGRCGLYIEMKKPAEMNKKNGGLSDNQVAFGAFVKDGGYATYVCYSWVEAKSCLTWYLS